MEALAEFFPVDFLGYYRAWALALYGVAFYCFMKGLTEVLHILETLYYWTYQK